MHQNPEFYAAAGSAIGGTLGGLYSSYGYVPPKIESADGMVYQVSCTHQVYIKLIAGEIQIREQILPFSPSSTWCDCG